MSARVTIAPVRQRLSGRDIDEACATQVRHPEEHPLIDATVHDSVDELESGTLRHPGGRIGEEIGTRVEPA